MSTREIGLLFTPENLRLVTQGRKTQTRRGNGLNGLDAAIRTFFNPDVELWSFYDSSNKFLDIKKCPYGNPQVEPTRYYLKESVQVLRIDDSNLDHITADITYPGDGILRETCTVTLTTADYGKLLSRVNWRERSSPMFMLKSFARHWVEGVRAWPEKLGDLSAEDAIAEGIERDTNIASLGYRDYISGNYDLSPVQSYASLWNSINGKKAPWSNERWVWCIEWKSTEATS